MKYYARREWGMALSGYSYNGAWVIRNQDGNVEAITTSEKVVKSLKNFFNLVIFNS